MRAYFTRLFFYFCFVLLFLYCFHLLFFYIYFLFNFILFRGVFQTGLLQGPAGRQLQPSSSILSKLAFWTLQFSISYVKTSNPECIWHNIIPLRQKCCMLLLLFWKEYPLKIKMRNDSMMSHDSTDPYVGFAVTNTCTARYDCVKKLFLLFKKNCNNFKIYNFFFDVKKKKRLSQESYM